MADLAPALTNAPTSQTATVPAALSLKLAPLSAAERMQRTRERRKKGLFCLTFELRESEVDMFVSCGRLKPEERASHAAIKSAVYEILEEFVLARTPFRATMKAGNRAPGAPA
jgi:hypothetical protein